MNEGLRDLYQEVIMDHNKKPRNYGPLADANRDAEGQNPLCGDEVHVQLHIEDGLVTNAHFEGHGCAISKASASLMTEAVKGRRVEEAETLFEHFHRLVTREGDAPDETLLGKLAVFAGVGEFPARVKCATLAWHTLHAALAGQDDPVTTE